MSGGSTTCPSAEMSRYSRAIAPPQTPSPGGSRRCCARPTAFSDFRVSLLRRARGGEAGRPPSTPARTELGSHRARASSVALELGGTPFGERPQTLAGIGGAHDELLRPGLFVEGGSPVGVQRTVEQPLGHADGLGRPGRQPAGELAGGGLEL